MKIPRPKWVAIEGIPPSRPTFERYQVLDITGTNPASARSVLSDRSIERIYAKYLAHKVWMKGMGQNWPVVIRRVEDNSIWAPDGLKWSVLHAVMVNEGGGVEPRFCSFDKAKADADYEAAVKDHCTDVTDDKEDPGAECEPTNINGRIYALRDQYGDLIVERFELTVE